MEDRKQELKQRLAELQNDVREAAHKAGRQGDEVEIIAVSKLHPAEDIRLLNESGQVHFGENYVQEAAAKQEELSQLGIKWHFIGGLQSNKAKFVAGNFELVHSIGSLKLAQVLHKKALAASTVQRGLLQVNIGREAQKSGILEEDLLELAEKSAGLKGLEIVGLMTMPPFFDDPDRSRPIFARLREVRDGLEAKLGLRLPHLSMGMTGDFEAAIAEGATLIRVGTRIFGPRPAK